MSKENRDLVLILGSVCMGCVFGYFFPYLFPYINWIGTVFINLLMVFVVPLIFVSLVTAIHAVKNLDSLKTMGLTTFLTIVANIAVASAIGLALSLVLKPGAHISPHFLNYDASTSKISGGSINFTDFIVSMFPPNIFDALSKTQILPIVTFGLIFSIACLRNREHESIKLIIRISDATKFILLKMIGYLLKTTPLAMFVLIGNMIAVSQMQNTLASDLSGLFKFILVFLVGCFILCILQFFIVFLLFPKQNTLRFAAKAFPAVVTGFATSSSLATLPAMMAAAQEQKINEEMSKFALPLTVVFNLGSSALYVSVAVNFVSQVLNIPLSNIDIMIIYVSTVITGLGATGIPNAGFIAAMTVLKIISVPSSTVSVLFPIDTLLSRVRTSINVWGHLVCVKIASRFTNKQE